MRPGGDAIVGFTLFGAAGHDASSFVHAGSRPLASMLNISWLIVPFGNCVASAICKCGAASSVFMAAEVMVPFQASKDPIRTGSVAKDTGFWSPPS